MYIMHIQYVYMQRETDRKKEIYFKKLVHVIVRTGKSIYRAKVGRVEIHVNFEQNSGKH